MPFGSPGDIHVNVPLTNVAMNYVQDETTFVASRAFPSVPVQKQSDQYYVFDRGEQNRDEFQLRAPATESAGATLTLSLDTYFARKWSLHYDISLEERANADPAINLEQMTTQSLMFKGLLRKELLFATNFMATSVWTTEYTGVSSSPATSQVLQWNDANSTPIEDTQTAMTAMQLLTGYRPNKLVLGQTVRDRLIRHPDIIDLIKYGGNNTNPAVVSDQTLAAVLGVPQVLTMGAVYNTAKEGATASHAFIGGGKSALLIYTPSAPTMRAPSAGYTFNWTGYLGNSPGGIVIDTFPLRRIKADRVEAEMFFDMKKTSADLGVYFGSIVA